MNAYLTESLFLEVLAALADTGRGDLVDRLRNAVQREADLLKSGEAAELLGVKSPNTVKNWLEGGAFPGAFKTAGGHWRFPRIEVLEVKHRLEGLEERNRRGELDPEETDNPEPPLF